MNTLLLDRGLWDLVLDAKGNIAMASDPYSLAQDAASAIKLFQNELWFDTTQGMPYWSLIIGRSPPLSLIKAKMILAAKSVPGVVAAQVYFSSYQNRLLRGQVQITDRVGNSAVASF